MDGTTAARDGSTDVLVLQSSLEVGHRWRWRDSRWCFVTGSLGWEVNLYTHGEDVGEGPIGSVGGLLTHGL